MRFRFVLDGAAYSKNKDAFKEILKGHGLMFRGTRDTFVWSSRQESVTATFERDEARDVTVQAGLVWQSRGPRRGGGRRGAGPGRIGRDRPRARALGRDPQARRRGTAAGRASRGVDRQGCSSLAEKAQGKAPGARGEVPARLGDRGRDLERVETVEAEPLATVIREKDDSRAALPAASEPIPALGEPSNVRSQLERDSPNPQRRGGSVARKILSL